jgi:hypothetical protein
MSEIVPFPAVRRVGFIRNMVRVMATYRADAAKRILQARLDATRAAMLRRGIRPDVVGREVRLLEMAIHTQLWTTVMQEMVSHERVKAETTHTTELPNNLDGAAGAPAVAEDALGTPFEDEGFAGLFGSVTSLKVSE